MLLKLSIQLFNGITVKLIRLNMIINIQGKEATESMSGNTALTVKLSVAGQRSEHTLAFLLCNHQNYKHSTLQLAYRKVMIYD